MQKWEKGKGHILNFIELTVLDPTTHTFSLTQSFPKVRLSYKILEQIRGYLCHLEMTFSIIFPYPKGFHLTLALHLPGRNAQGWKLNNLELLGHLEILKEKGLIPPDDVQNGKVSTGLTQQDPPSTILLVPRFTFV